MDEENKQPVNHKDLHPSGLTMERWRFPFKTPQEQEMIRRWLAVNNLDSNAIPF